MENWMMSTNPRRPSRRQTLAELGIVMPFLLFLLLGIVQVSFLIYQQYDAINLAREAANLIVRDDHLDVAASATKAAQLTRSLDTDVKLILSVVPLGPQGSPNEALPIIPHRHVAGTLSGDSVLGDPPPAAYGQPPPAGDDPTYGAIHPATDQNIRAKTPLPNALQIQAGQSVYVAEVYIKRRDILPLSATAAPLYSVAYF